ncbi:MAG TPA: endo-1,4-beta-xylanase [Terracidiphilus sp.]|nr:endo-1,4-beta-xylanase [Terracidiphilus sp.]
MLSRREFIARGTGTAFTFAAAAGSTGLLAGCAKNSSTHPPTVASFHDLAGSRSLRAHARRHGLIYGSAVVIPVVKENADFASLLSEQCGILVPSNELKWVALRPSREAFNFGPPDFLYDFSQRNHMLMRGHTLCWHQSVPAWIKTIDSKDEIRQIFVDHITTVCKHYAGKMQSWDVVNEAIEPDDKLPGGLRKSFWYENLGPDYIDLAFHTARAADPSVKLTYNDYGIEGDSDNDAEKRRLILEMVKGMKNRGVPIDAIGVQSHLNAGEEYGQGVADYIEAIHQLGLEVYLTELDVNDDSTATDDVPQRDAVVAKTYTDFLTAALPNPAVKLVLTWDLSDKYTWLNSLGSHRKKRPNRDQRPLPFDADLKPTDCFYALRDSFNRHKLV